MPTFSAINVEPEESVDEEVDNTRQHAQIDDALKIFQTALKLHAQGPSSFLDAGNAYDALFESEIFKYPEASTEFERAEHQPHPLLALEPSLGTALDAPAVDADGSGSSLPQALYLAYKNHGQFALDRIRHKAHSAGAASAVVFQEPEVLHAARGALEDFDAALDRDPADAELWRRTSRVAGFLNSARVGRYCLEAAIELDDDPAVFEVEPPSLAEGFAGEQLKSQLKLLSDDIALTHPIMAPYIRRELASALRRYLDPLPWLPNPTAGLTGPRPALPTTSLSRLRVEVANAGWTELGSSLVRFATETGLSGQALELEMLDLPDELDTMQQELDQQLQASEQSTNPSNPKLSALPRPTVAESGAADDPVLVADAGAKEKEPSKDSPALVPSRKRSQSAAGIAEPGDEDNGGDTKRSKRIRRRDTAAEEAVDPRALFANQLQPYHAADESLFRMAKNMLESLGVSDRTTLDRLSEFIETCSSDERTAKLGGNLAMMDLRDALVSFDAGHAKILLSKRDAPALGLNAFLEHTKSGTQLASEKTTLDETAGLKSFVRDINTGWFTIHDIAFEWVMAMSKTYATSKWADVTKRTVVHVISRLDAAIYDRVRDELDRLDVPDTQRTGDAETLEDLECVVQTLFELYLDVYERITNPSSVVEYTVRVETKGRLARWMDIAAGLARSSRRAETSILSLRFLWSSVFSVTLSDDISRDHILSCWESLREFLIRAGRPTITLPNNVVMPEISSRAADREISKLTTMDFFLGLFQEDLVDPVAVIDTLEPVLNPDSVVVPLSSDVEGPGTNGVGDQASRQKATKKAIAECASQGLRDLWKFLLGSSTDLRLFLWSRLGDAYSAIGYSTKHFSCQLRSIEVIITDLERELYLDSPPETRRLLFMQMLKSLDDAMIEALTLALNDNSAFDIIDEDHIRASASALSRLASLLHVAVLYEDEVRIGMTQATSSGPTFQSFLTKLREMQVRAWSLLYTVLKVGVCQHKATSVSPDNDLAGFLAAVHEVLGLRRQCKASNKIFLKMMRVELLKQKSIENWEDHLGQVLYDLHGLKLGVGAWEVQEHGCPAEKLERKNAIALVEKVTVLANRVPMKDLLKSDLKAAIEHMQQAIGQTKSTTQMIHNLRYFTEYLKRPIHPLRLYQAFKGNVILDAATANTPDNAVAKNGWFFLMGMIALTKFKGVALDRRQTPGATDDLRIGAQYLRLQLQLTPDRWDAWFRLAECFDYDLDEAVLWTAEKINKERGELVKLQRNAIHCYTLALSYSHAAPDELTGDESEALFEMYHNFGMRMYASSREPFGMEAFQHVEQERYFIEPMGTGTYKRILHGQMSDYKVWKYAARLFRWAMAGRPKDWKNPYMLAKCLWKMYQKPIGQLDGPDQASRPQLDEVVQALEKTVEVVSLLPKPRHGQDPILEPHYKILSVIHKLVMRGDLTAQEGANILQRQPYAIQQGDGVKIDDAEKWEGHVIRTLRHLRDKDKSNWQHRLIARHARILFDADDSPDGGTFVQAKAAFSVLKESMFTKTMVMNVWKCDAERPGRHHVYTEQYVRLMTRLLVVMSDRPNLEALLRRIRKKGADFYHFGDLWQACVTCYIRLLRHTYQVPPTDEDVFKNVSPEEFEIVAERITEWVGQSGTENRALSAMREAVELKKLNATLMKAAPIDDLITDCYGALYVGVGHDLPGEEPAKILEERQRRQKEAAERAADGSARSGPVGLPALGGEGADASRAGSEAPGEKAEKPVLAVGDHPVRRGRAPGVVRRQDVMRKAEQAILRLTEPPAKSAASASRSSSGKNGHVPNSGSGEGDEEEDAKEAEDGEGGASDAVSSPRGSVHDSADDESDLSDVPPDTPPALLFPNLGRAADIPAAAAHETDRDSDGQSTGDDEGSSPAPLDVEMQ